LRGKGIDQEESQKLTSKLSLGVRPSKKPRKGDFPGRLSIWSDFCRLFVSKLLANRVFRDVSTQGQVANGSVEKEAAKAALLPQVGVAAIIVGLGDLGGGGEGGGLSFQFDRTLTGTKFGGHRFLSATTTTETIGMRSSSISGLLFSTFIHWRREEE
jgi:hypothetical protein